VNYSKWSPELLNPEQEFYKAFDPRIWFSAALQFHKSAEVDLKLEYLDGEPVTSDDVSDSDFQSNFASTRRLFLRQFRYQSSELLLSLMLCTQRDMPYLRFASKIKADELNKKFALIAERKTPYRLTRTGEDEELSFKEWVEYSLTGQINADLCETIAAFVQQEGKLISDRSAINAMKHGRAAVDIVDSNASFRIKMDGKYKDILEPSPAITFFQWKEKVEIEHMRFEVTRGIEAVDSEYDLIAIQIASTLMNCIKQRRLAMLGLKVKPVLMLEKVALKSIPFRAKFPIGTQST